MKVLLIGGAGFFIDNIIYKLKKNGHQVYLLTGKKNKHISYPHVFERYDHPYDTDNIEHIFKSICPDVTIFMGAYDTNFEYIMSRHDLIYCSTSVMNLLSAWSVIHSGRFIYISSQDVYVPDYGHSVRELDSTDGQTFRSLAISYGEELCKNYHVIQNLDICVIRFDHVYGVPNKGEILSDPCFTMCRDALLYNKIRIDKGHEFSMIYISDAVECLYKLLTKQALDQFCYQVSSGDVINDEKLSDLVCSQAKEHVKIIDNSLGKLTCLTLDDHLYINEFEFAIFVSYDTGVANVFAYMRKHKQTFISSDDATKKRGIVSCLSKTIPFIENVIGFVCFFVMSICLKDHTYFTQLDPYFLYVLLFAVTYGQWQAVLSSVLSIIGRYVGSDFEFDSSLYLWMAQLFTVGMTVGYIRDSLFYAKDEYQETVSYLKDKLHGIESINDSNIRIKESFETQVINQKDSLGKIYSITSQLYGLNPEDILFHATELLSDLMHTKDVAIYISTSDSYARLFSYTSEKARTLGNSVCYADVSEMISILRQGRVFLNQSLDSGLPMMACGVFDGDRLSLIFMLWSLDYNSLRLSEADRFSVISMLVKQHVIQAKRYLDSLYDRRYIDLEILDQESFSKIITSFLHASERGLTDCTLITFSDLVIDQNIISDIRTYIRVTDYLGMLDNKLSVLLLNTDVIGADIVLSRLRVHGYACDIKGGWIRSC